MGGNIACGPPIHPCRERRRIFFSRDSRAEPQVLRPADPQGTYRCRGTTSHRPFAQDFPHSVHHREVSHPRKPSPMSAMSPVQIVRHRPDPYPLSPLPHPAAFISRRAVKLTRTDGRPALAGVCPERSRTGRDL
jgi:hypothetical protein